MSADTPSGLTRQAISQMRRSYGQEGLATMGDDPLASFATWLHEAANNEYIVEANAMVLSTLSGDADGNDDVCGDDVDMCVCDSLCLRFLNRS